MGIFPNCLLWSDNYNHSSSPCLGLQSLSQEGSLNVRAGSEECTQVLQYILFLTGLIVPWPVPCPSSYPGAPPKKPTYSMSHICSPPTLLSIIKLALDEVMIHAKNCTMPFKHIVVFIHYQVYGLSIILHCFIDEKIETQRF